MRSPLQCCAALVFCLHLHLPAGLQSVPKQRAWGASPTPAKPLCTITCPSSRAALPRAVIVTSSIHFWGCFFTFSPVPIQAFLFSFVSPLLPGAGQEMASSWRGAARSWELAQPCLEPHPLPRCRLLCWECCPQGNFCCGLITFAGLYSFFYYTHFLYLFPFSTHNWNIQMKM